MQVLIVVSTMTGTSEMVAEDLAAELTPGQATIVLAENTKAEQVRAATVLLVVSSTYGNGEVPEPAQRLFGELHDGPELNGFRFGVVGLGDRSLYATTFAAGGRHWDEMLAAKGALRLADRLSIDVASAENLSAPAIAWIHDALEGVAC